MRKAAAARPATARRAAKKPVKKAAEPPMDLAVGRRIRDLRRGKQMSLETVAARTELSIGFISQIERGLSSPSLRVLATLADVLGVGIAALFGAAPSDDSAANGIVTRETQRAELKLWRTGISKQLLSPAGSESRLNLFLVHLEPGGNTGDEFYTHDGEEAGLVLAGEMTLTVDTETWTLKQGDSFRFASRRPHRFSNPARDAKAAVLWVNCVTAAG
jgi:transcriptional regulator with XRE-family HTH domain